MRAGAELQQYLGAGQLGHEVAVLPDPWTGVCDHPKRIWLCNPGQGQPGPVRPARPPPSLAPDPGCAGDDDTALALQLLPVRLGGAASSPASRGLQGLAEAASRRGAPGSRKVQIVVAGVEGLGVCSWKCTGPGVCACRARA